MGWVALAIGVLWVSHSVVFLGGLWFGATAAVSKQIVESDHARFVRDELVRDEAWLLDEAG